MKKHYDRFVPSARNVTLALAIAALLSSCTLAPKYERPAAPVPTAWPQGDAVPQSVENNNAAGHGRSAVEVSWEEFLGDDRLRRLVHLALENNRDLRIASLRVDQVRAQYRIERSELLPSVDAVGAVRRQKTTEAQTLPGAPLTTTAYSVSAGITAYELDLFGRVRSLTRQALETYFATQEAQRTAQISLIAEVAIRYLAERSTVEQLAVAEETLKAVEASYRLSQRRYDVGNISQLDLRTAEAQVQGTRAQVASYRQQRAQAENALVYLIGQPLPSDLPEPKPLNDQRIITDISAGLPSDLLQRRPDILQAEHELKAANANIGAARAAFFPSISLTASAGTVSPELSGLFDKGTGTWSFAPQITLPLFTAGRNRALLDVAKLSKLIEVAQYEQAIQNAFREVADALVVRSQVDEQIQATQALVAAQQQRYNLADARYQRGVDSFLTVLTAQQDLYAAQQNLIAVREAKFANLVTLYRALGGGWSEGTPVAAK